MTRYVHVPVYMIRAASWFLVGCFQVFLDPPQHLSSFMYLSVDAVWIQVIAFLVLIIKECLK